MGSEMCIRDSSKECILSGIKIPLSPLFPDVDWDSVKIHVAQKSGESRPIDVFAKDFDAWQNGWNGSYHSNHCWNREFVFSIIEIPNKPNCWLFGGIFRVVSHKPAKNRVGKDCIFYEVELDKRGLSFIGRLIINWEKDARAKGRKPETMLKNMSVSEVLPELYAGEDFPGYANIDHPYSVLDNLWQDMKPDWYSALVHCKGVYLITDSNTGLRYVGSAYGEDGIWSRWNTYFLTEGHGNNKLLKKHLKAVEKGYAEKHFKFSLLEQASSRDSEQYIIQRESYWKEVLMTRGEFGLNDN